LNAERPEIEPATCEYRYGHCCGDELKTFLYVEAIRKDTATLQSGAHTREEEDDDHDDDDDNGDDKRLNREV